MLAYIHWTNKIVNDQLGVKYFQGKSSKYGFIDISDIDRCVGFIKINNRIYIFDKENQRIKYKIIKNKKIKREKE